MRVDQTRIVTIIGAGMSGTLLAVLLARRGFEVELFEQQADPNRFDTGIEQSIDFTLGERARHALDEAGLLQKVDALCTAVHGRMIHNRAGNLTLQPYGNRDSDALYSIRRKRLRSCLLDEAESTGSVRIHFDHRLTGVDWKEKKALFTIGTADGSDAQKRRIPFEVLIGADGPVSGLRRAMNEASDLGLHEELLDSGYKKFTIPQDEGGGFALDPGVLHVWPRGGYMLIAFPDLEGSFSALLFLPRTGDHKMMWGFAELDSWIRQRAFMQFNFPDAVAVIPELEREFGENPVGLLGTVRCKRWHHGGQALLIGDAAHTIVPFHGQGVNAAFEDCSTLMGFLDAGASEWATVFEKLQKQRKKNTDVLADMSLDAYQTMRVSVRHRDFMLRKALERELERRHPGRFVARYSLVMFHRIAYREAFKRGKAQSKILDKLLKGRGSLNEIDFARADRLIGKHLCETVEH